MKVFCMLYNYLKQNNPELLDLALTHKSYFFENKKVCKGYNEKLEFLGDAAVNLFVGQYLYLKYPELSEGDLSKRRSFLVNASTLAEFAYKIKLDQQIQLGKGELQTGGKQKQSVMSCAFEALFGAIYLTGGMEAVKVHLQPLLDDALENDDCCDKRNHDYKSALQELVQKNKGVAAPIYLLNELNGPSHDREFDISVMVNGKELGRATGSSKKIAEQSAAKFALAELENIPLESANGTASIKELQ